MHTDGPSWSWVSADNEVVFSAHDENYVAHTKLVDYQCHYGLGGEFGLPESAVITLEGPACPLHLVSDSQQSTVGAPFPEFWWLDHPLEVAFLPDGTGRTVRPNLGAPTSGNHVLNATVDLLLLLVGKRWGFWYAFFLILAKSDTQEQRYIRIGVLWQRIDGHQGFMGMKSHFRQTPFNRWIASMETKQFVLI
ncbi:hypothetical protein LTS15_008860 [Exophiala xenobiotica]|nr:hypothetical protein LTS15_008860 [Exophiala xenobiotica]